MRRSADHHRVRLRQGLQPRGHVRCLAKGKLLAAVPGTHLADDHEAGVDAHPHGQADTARGLPCVDGADSLHDREPSAHRALGVIAVRGRITPIHEQAVPEVLGDVAVESRDHARARGLITAHMHAQLFGVEAAGERRRAHEVAEHDAELAPFRVGNGGGRRRRLYGHDGRWCLARRRALRRPGPERETLPATAAELVTGLVAETASRACHGQQRAALRAETASRPILGPAGTSSRLFVRGKGFIQPRVSGCFPL